MGAAPILTRGMLPVRLVHQPVGVGNDVRAVYSEIQLYVPIARYLGDLASVRVCVNGCGVITDVAEAWSFSDF